MRSGDRPKNAHEWMRLMEQRTRDLDSRIRNAAPSAALAYTAGNQVVATNGSGQASFTFGATYAAAPVVVATGGNTEQVSIVSVTTTGFTAQFYNPAGAPIASLNVRCLWHALPAT